MKKLTFACLLLVIAAFLPTTVLAETIDHAEILDGHIALDLVNATDLLVTVDLVPADGVADHAFVYRSTEDLPSGLGQIDGRTPLVVRADALLLFPRNAQPLRLALIADPTAKRSQLEKNGNFLHITSGYQISRLRANEGEDLTAAAQAYVRPFQPSTPFFVEAAVIGGDDGCLGGGPGATSCSVEGTVNGSGLTCSVSCGSGYFACCGVGGCHCEGLN